MFAVSASPPGRGVRARAVVVRTGRRRRGDRRLHPDVFRSLERRRLDGREPDVRCRDRRVFGPVEVHRRREREQRPDVPYLRGQGERRPGDRPAVAHRRRQDRQVPLASGLRLPIERLRLRRGGRREQGGKDRHHRRRTAGQGGRPRRRRPPGGRAKPGPTGTNMPAAAFRVARTPRLAASRHAGVPAGAQPDDGRTAARELSLHSPDPSRGTRSRQPPSARVSALAIHRRTWERIQ